MDHSGPERDLSSGEDIEQHESTLPDPVLEPRVAIPATAVADVAQPRGVWVTTGMFGSDWQQQQRQSSEPRVPLLGNQPVTTGHSPSPAPLSRAEIDETVPQSRPEDSSSAGSRLVGAASNSRPDTQQHRTDSSTSEPDPLGDVSATGTREGTREDTDTDAKRKPPHIGSHAVAEQRKQRRLAKNREAAAVSRERKRVELTRLQQRVQALEHENAGLSYTLTLRENELGKAREELASLRRGARGDSQTVHAPASAAPGGKRIQTVSESNLVLKVSPCPASDSPAVGMHISAAPDSTRAAQPRFQQQRQPSLQLRSSSNEPAESAMRALPNMLSGNNRPWQQLAFGAPPHESGQGGSSSNSFQPLPPNQPYSTYQDQACHQGEQQFCAMDAGISPAAALPLDSRPIMSAPASAPAITPPAGWPQAQPAASQGQAAYSEAVEWDMMDPEAFPGDLFDWPT